MKNFQRMLFFALFMGVFVVNSNILAMKNKVGDSSLLELRLEVIGEQLEKLNISEKDIEYVFFKIYSKALLRTCDKRDIIKLIRSAIPEKYLYKTEQIQKDLAQRISKLASTSYLDLSSIFKNYTDSCLVVTILNVVFGLLCELRVEIKDINLSQNGLTTLPRSLFKLSSLEKLDISRNKLKLLSKDLVKLKNLKSLNLSYSNIYIFDFLDILKSLKSLNVLFEESYTYDEQQEVFIYQELEDVCVYLGVDYYAEHLKCCA